MATLQRRYVRTEDMLSLLVTPRDDIAHEQVDSDTTFSLASGPFRTYHRSVEVLPETLVERTKFHLAIPWFGWLFVPFVWFSLRRPPGPDRFSGRQPVWAPPPARSSHLL